jgi:5-methylcytosine-specific restriction endonuclease McrA
MKKGDHPSLERMGFRKGHEAYCDWSHVNERLASDPVLRTKWLRSKKGQVAWNRGKTKKEYSRDFPTGKDHGNWCGGVRGFRDTSEYRQLRLEILKRDNYTCQLCGDRNHEGRGSRIILHVDHILPTSSEPSLGMNPSNLRTLCIKCHRATDTYGTKAVTFRRYYQSKSSG